MNNRWVSPDNPIPLLSTVSYSLARSKARSARTRFEPEKLKNEAEWIEAGEEYSKKQILPRPFAP
jgi:hypothetical protein